ncbi:MAG: DUF924 family protein [Pelistega sp.]|nr:DUF924 family protein [Pelistega sp.]
MNYQDILDFWFKETAPELWFVRSDELDLSIREKFYTTWQAACAGELEPWRATIHGRLAEIIVLDQFSRNLNRDSPLAFAQDAMALVLAQEALKQVDFASLTELERNFLLLPYMHSESAKIHEIAAPLLKQYTSANTYDFELKHKVIIDRFGRYPHRNAVLGRTSSAEEIAFLQEPNSSF